MPVSYAISATDMTIERDKDGETVELDVEVRFVYTPEERQTWETPCYPADAELYNVFVKETQIDILPELTREEQRAISRRITERIEDSL